ncbi:restriction endonuclease subunit S [Staphylococcus haemolyticus]
MEYKEILLKDLASKIGDGLHGTPSYDPKGDFYFVNGNNLEEGNIVIKDTTKTVNRETFEKYKKDLSKRTLLVSINGTIGKIAKFNNENIVLGKSACYINLNDTADKNYIYFLLKSREFQNYIQQYATGTTIKNVSLKTIRNFKVKLPALKYQNKVSTILQNIENKIQLNYKMIANLEKLSQTLFKHWFVDFEFPDKNGNPYKSSGGEMVDSELGEIPKGWRVETLEKLGSIVGGGTPSKKIRSITRITVFLGLPLKIYRKIEIYTYPMVKMILVN